MARFAHSCVQHESNRVPKIQKRKNTLPEGKWSGATSAQRGKTRVGNTRYMPCICRKNTLRLALAWGGKPALELGVHLVAFTCGARPPQSAS
jgi:hypothetical protein